jgi:serine/threonine protein kinase
VRGFVAEGEFPKPVVDAEGMLRAAFLREALIASRVRSPFVGEVLELSPTRQSGLYAVMPFYEGETLEARVVRSSSKRLLESGEAAV